MSLVKRQQYAAIAGDPSCVLEGNGTCIDPNGLLMQQEWDLGGGRGGIAERWMGGHFL